MIFWDVIDWRGNRIAVFGSRKRALAFAAKQHRYVWARVIRRVEP